MSETNCYFTTNLILLTVSKCLTSWGKNLLVLLKDPVH